LAQKRQGGYWQCNPKEAAWDAGLPAEGWTDEPTAQPWGKEGGECVAPGRDQEVITVSRCGCGRARGVCVCERARESERDHAAQDRPGAGHTAVGRRPSGRGPGEEHEYDRAAQQSAGAVRKVGGGHPSGCDPGEVIGRRERSEGEKEGESDGRGGRVRDQADQDGSRADHQGGSWCPYEHDPSDQPGGPGASGTAVGSGCSLECHLRRVAQDQSSLYGPPWSERF
jgi:hypothetical protein